MAGTKKSAGAATKKESTGAGSKKASAPKINERQTGFLHSIRDAGAAGHQPANGNEQKTIDVLAKHKLVKRTGKKDPETGRYHCVLTKAGAKHLDTLAQDGAQGSSPASSAAGGEPSGSI